MNNSYFLFYFFFYVSLISPVCSIEEPAKVSDKAPEDSSCVEKEEFSETSHEVTIDGKRIAYQAVAGNLILKDDKCHPEASIFFMSYTKEDPNDAEERPITFCFNGGPGSSSVWLHLGLLGPKRVFLSEQGDALPPYHLVDNDYSLLDVSDLVFIDPVATGYSHAIAPQEDKHFLSVEEDVKSIAKFIRLYLTRFNRWESPKFIAGESYGTLRASRLASYLHDHEFIYTNGLLLISTVLNFQSIDFSAGNDLPYSLFLPTYTATAWYHKKLAPDLQKNLIETLKASRQFASQDYAVALFKGDLIEPEEKKRIVQQLARFTGLSAEYIERQELRVSMSRFAKELLRDRKRTIGYFDSRFSGVSSNMIAQHMDYDPSAEAIFGAFTATFNHYVRNNLKWAKDAAYKILSDTVMPSWDWGITNQYLNVAESLRDVVTKNRFLRVFVANGYYDLATPFFGTEYTFSHLGLAPSFSKHVTMKYYEAGHMMYIYRPALAQMKQDLVTFYRDTLIQQEEEERDPSNLH